ncbi:MAG: phenylalanine--tRNA ligase subunit beta, partial [Gammaproteobacteria bacterium]|nr:phenylalanine--tRNA ligase subunit beta [Gammaproteobacteria bacterium]
MKISENWLREQVNVPGDTAALVHQLTMLGLEVEGVEAAGPALDGIVVGRVRAVTPHPNADRLRICQVDVGTGGDVQIVCGAANVRADGLYPVALPGAVLPGGTKIGRAELRGVPSAGMLCSAVELGIGDAAAGKSEGLLELDTPALPGAPVAGVLALPDAILELKITPNRADCFSVTGVARDLAAATASAHVPPRLVAVPAVDNLGHDVRVEAAADCPVFAVRGVRGVRPDARSPLWLRERLRRSGLRSISAVVDITNLVMLELGQPLHAYDLDRLEGGLVVRRARQGEQLALLTGGSATLGEDFLVIADHAQAVGLAGIMGGAGTAVSAATANVLFESACFTPGVIAGRARRLGLQTDAATRFERGVDPTGQVRALERATELLL